MRTASLKHELAELIIITFVFAVGPGKLYGIETNEDTQATSPPIESRTNGPGTDNVSDMPRASEVIGLVVVNKEQQHLGRVSDLVIGREGRVSYLIISRGGVLGMGDQLCALPWQAVKPQLREKTLLVDISKERFEGAPKFANWIELRSGEYRDKVLAYYAEEKPAPTE